MRLCYQQKITGIEKFVGEMAAAGRERQKQFLNYSLQFVRDCLVVQYGREEIVRLNNDEQKFVRNFAPYVNSANGYQFAEELNKAIYHIERNANPSILFMDLSLKIGQLLKMKLS
jgi:DNA polymerase-3 subunit delta'